MISYTFNIQLELNCIQLFIFKYLLDQEFREFETKKRSYNTANPPPSSVDSGEENVWEGDDGFEGDQMPIAGTVELNLGGDAHVDDQVEQPQASTSAMPEAAQEAAPEAAPEVPKKKKRHAFGGIDENSGLSATNSFHVGHPLQLPRPVQQNQFGCKQELLDLLNRVCSSHQKILIFESRDFFLK